MPFNLSLTHLLVVGIVALVVLGPERLPGVARTAGNLYREWQRIRGDLEGEVREAINEFKEPFQESVGGIQETVKGTVGGLHDTLQGTVDEFRDVAGAAPPLSSLPPLGDAGALTAAMPSLGPSSQLVSPGPVMAIELPPLAAAPMPDTFVPFPPHGLSPESAG